MCPRGCPALIVGRLTSYPRRRCFTLSDAAVVLITVDMLRGRLKGKPTHCWQRRDDLSTAVAERSTGHAVSARNRSLAARACVFSFEMFLHYSDPGSVLRIVCAPC